MGLIFSILAKAVKFTADFPQRIGARRSGTTYDVALSFAGEDREYVDKVAKCLVRMGLSVFYDRYEIVSLWGKDLYEHLTSVYSDQGDTIRFNVSKRRMPKPDK